MKTLLSLLVIAVMAAGQLKAQVSGNPVTDVILSGYSVRNYSTEPVTDQQLDLILKCGIKVPQCK